MGKESNRTVSLALVCAGLGLATATWVARGQADETLMESTGQRLRSLREMHLRHLEHVMDSRLAGTAALALDDAVREWAADGVSVDESEFERTARTLGAESALLATLDGELLAGAARHGERAVGVLADGIAALADPATPEPWFTDFAPYAPRQDAVRGFTLARVREPGAGADGPVIGYLAFEQTTDEWSTLLTGGGRWHEEGLGATGEVYLVGADHTMRTESRFLAEDRASYADSLVLARTPEDRIDAILERGSSILLQEVRTEGVDAALEGISDTRQFEDYRGEPVLSSFGPLEVGGQRFALLAEMDMTEVRSAGNRVSRDVLLPAGGLLLFVGALASWFGGRRTAQLHELRRSAFAAARTCEAGVVEPELVEDELAACRVAIDTLGRGAESLRREAHFFRTIFAQDPEPVVVCAYPARATREGRDDPKLLAISGLAADLTGLEPAEVPRANLSDVLRDDATREEGFNAWLDELCDEGHLEGVTVRLQPVDGEPLECRLRATVSTAGSEEQWFLVLVAQPVEES